MDRFARAAFSGWGFGSLVVVVVACNSTSPDSLMGSSPENVAGASGSAGAPVSMIAAGCAAMGGALTMAGGSPGVAGIPLLGNGGAAGMSTQAMGGSLGNGGLPGMGGAPFGQGGRGGFGMGRAGMSAAGSGNGGAMPAGGAAGSAGAGTAGAGGCVQDLKCMPTAPNTGDIYADCVARVNQFRACACLPPLQRWMDGEACANQDASYDAMNQSMGAHAGFKAKICAAGSAQDECPGWRSNEQVISGCLQQMFNEGPPPMNPCTGTCYEQHGHFINMTNTRYTMVACGYYTASNGQIWAVQNFK